uniref:RING-type domain-containing protein n=1 Tax=Chenopodium quinoa TaxID=63459 RepID=A0A803L790_CHEQI
MALSNLSVSVIAYFAPGLIVFIVFIVKACLRCCCGENSTNHDAAVNITVPRPACGSANLVQPEGQARSSLPVRGNPRQHRNLGESQSWQPNRDAESVVIDIEKILESSKNCGDCVICLDSFGVEKDDEYGGVKVLEQCEHKFHEFCIDEWLRKYGTTCPICRTYVYSSVLPLKA